MEADPLVIIQDTKNLSYKHVSKALKKFLNSHRSGEANLELANRDRISAVSDDILDKISIVIQGIDSVGTNSISVELTDTPISDKSIKKRKQSLESENLSEEDKKKKKKSKKRKSNVQAD